MNGTLNKKATILISGDSLEDDFRPDGDFYPDDDELSQASLDLSTPNDAVNTPSSDSKKRKLPEENQEKPKKKKSKKKNFDGEPAVPLASLDVASQAKFVLNKQRETMKNLSSMELDEQKVPETSFLNTEKFKSEHTLEHLSSFCKFGVSSHTSKFMKKPKNDNLITGQPVVLILTYSAIRAVDLVRALSNFKETAKIAKLFAKHLKVEEQEAFLKRSFVNFAVGTAGRVNKLLEETDSLKLDRMELLIIDCEKDVKQRTIFDNVECSRDLYRFIGSHFVKIANSGQARIAFY